MTTTMSRVKHLYPRFYIKSVAGRFSLMHRLTHNFIGAFDTVEEIVEDIKDWNRLEGKEYWEVLLDIPTFFMQSRNAYESTTNKKDDSEDWFTGAWSVFTDKFYEDHPELLIVEEEIPYELVNEIRRERFLEQDKISKELEKEKRELEKYYQDEVKQQALNSKKKEEVPDGKIGNRLAMDKLKNKKKRAKKKVTITTKGNKVITIADSTSLFD